MSRFFVLVLLFCLCAVPAIAVEGRLTILHFNDFHGQLAAYEDSDSGKLVAGFARMSAKVQEIRAEDPERPVLLLFAGDLLQGTMLSTLFKGQPDIQLFNDLGLDAAVLGNHEFDYGRDNYNRLVQSAEYPILAANVHMPSIDAQLEKSRIFELSNGLRVGVLGLTTSDLVTATHPRNSEGVTVADPLETAASNLPELDADSDLLLVLSHLGYKADRQLAARFDDLDLIVGGHNHFRFDPPKQENGVLLAQAGERGRWLGRMDLLVRDDRAVLEHSQLISLDESVPEDPAVAARVAELSAKVSSEMDQVVGKTQVLLDGKREIIRRTESNLGSLVADLARNSTGAELVLINSGSFRDSIPPGPVTLGQIQRVFPFGNTLVSGELTGAQVQAALAHSAAMDPLDNPGGFLQVSGLRFQIRDGRAEDVRLADGRRLDPQASYQVVTSDFISAGGDGYAMFKQMRDPIDTGHRFSDLLVEAFRAASALNPLTDGRIQRLP